ncbi:DegT/DnrJ/EryC1/StrS aminotransferase family protein [Staphylococcus sp. 17KM0847]|uniref:DegT/DnrJ/EryC1/StrS family aminotransferase n=1 Tax=Staphylococcus sp. 17KM0847 TaxID=2583989 RepID=UPI0015DC9382|nr:DegT/DnrJ/EryC1/StrS family aminotransferase [Staphylococcus sp. 17KM0847]QLK85756.1 DegT/DnrJ/EryC1/StrS family aminotransferase [Staphylococcus sp. 17KM0847]
MTLKSSSIFKFRNNIQELQKHTEMHTNKYLSSNINIAKQNLSDTRVIQKVEFMPVNRLIREDESEKIMEVLKDFLPTGKYTSGKYISEFEKYLSEYLSIDYVIALSSGTSALTIGLIAIGVKAGDEVILPSNSFSATENAVLSLDAVPIYADVKDDFTICPSSIEKLITPKTKAILPVHLYGRFCDMVKIKDIASKYEIKVIEDACQGIGLEEVGLHSDLAALSFNPYKNLGVCGKAGAIITNNAELDYQCRLISYHDFDLNEKNKKIVDFGFNSKIDNTQALIGIVRMEYLTFNQYRRLKIAEKYYQELSNMDNIILPPLDDKSVWHLYPIRIKNNMRDFIKSKLEKFGVQSEIYYPYLSHKQLSYKKKVFLPNTEKLHKELLCLPLYPNLSNEEQEYVISTLKMILEELK